MAKRAFICGINQYESINGLRGCINDVQSVRFALKEFAGFTNDEVRMVADARATKPAIEERIAWLVDGAQAGDLLVMHFSGHGSQVRDRGPQDELLDHMDEILCPWDMDWDDQFITDDFLDERLLVPPGVVLEVILDCCNSGDSQGRGGLQPANSEPAGRLARFAQPPLDVVARHEGDSLPQRRLFARRPANQLCRWAACADSQTAADADIEGVPNGAFTFHLCRVLQESQGQLARKEVLRRVRAALSLGGFTQTPELAAPPELASKPMFRR